MDLLGILNECAELFGTDAAKAAVGHKEIRLTHGDIIVAPVLFPSVQVSAPSGIMDTEKTDTHLLVWFVDKARNRSADTEKSLGAMGKIIQVLRDEANSSRGWLFGAGRIKEVGLYEGEWIDDTKSPPTRLTGGVIRIKLEGARSTEQW